MNTTATNLSNIAAKAATQVAPFAALYSQRSKVRLWAFAAAVRLSDQDKPIALKLLVELAIVIRMLALLAQQARCATGKKVIAHRAPRPARHVVGRRGKLAKRAVAVKVRQTGAVTLQRTSHTGAIRAYPTTTAGPRPRLTGQIPRLKITHFGMDGTAETVYVCGH